MANSAVTLHLIKLCVGCDSIQDLEDWIKEKRRRTRGKKTEHIHTTRMVPKRADEIIGSGSLYWVIRGQVMCRERVLAVRPFVDKEGVGRCRIVLEPKVTPVEPQAVAGVPGLALSRGQGRAARPDAHRAGTARHAGGDAPRAAGSGADLKPPGLLQARKGAPGAALA